MYFIPIHTQRFISHFLSLHNNSIRCRVNFIILYSVNKSHLNSLEFRILTILCFTRLLPKLIWLGVSCELINFLLTIREKKTHTGKPVTDTHITYSLACYWSYSPSFPRCVRVCIIQSMPFDWLERIETWNRIEDTLTHTNKHEIVCTLIYA